MVAVSEVDVPSGFNTLLETGHTTTQRMPSPSVLERRSVPMGFTPILLANVIPLVGVLLFGWDPQTLVVIYALEALLSFPLAAAKALFAHQPPRTDEDGSGVISVSNELAQKRGCVQPISGLPPIYPRNIPFATAVVGAAVWFGIFVGVVLATAFSVAETIRQPEVLVSVVGLFAGQAIESWRDYFRGGRYETVSPYTVVETPARQLFFLLFVLFVTPGIAVGGAVSVLVVFVLVKLLVEWSAFRATHGDGGRLSGWLAGPETATAPSDPPLVPGDEPTARISTDDQAVLYTGVLHTLTTHAPVYAMWFLMVWVTSLVVLGGEEPATTMTVGSLLVVVGLFVFLVVVRVGEFYLRYGPLEYRRYEDHVVAYDVWLDEPQWSSPIDVLCTAEIVRHRLPDRMLGTRTITVTTGWGDDETNRHLGPVADPDALIEALELPIRTTALEPIDRRFAALTVALIGSVIVAIVLAIGPWAPFVGVLYVVFVLPFAVPVLKALWRRGYPDPR